MITLQIEQPGQIRMIEPKARGRRDDRLTAEGNSKPRGLKHRDVVRAVADSSGGFEGNPAVRSQPLEDHSLGVSVEDRLGDAAGDLATRNDQSIRLELVEAALLRDCSGKAIETP